MAIIYVLFAFFVLLTLYDFKKGVLLFMPFKLFFGMNVRLLPSMTVDFAFCLFAISLFALVCEREIPFKKMFCHLFSFLCVELLVSGYGIELYSKNFD